MRFSGRLKAVILFAGIGLLALFFSGLLNWITSFLFLILELLAEFLRRLFLHRRTPRTHGAPRTRRTQVASLPASSRSRNLLPRRFGPRRRRESAEPLVAKASPPLKPTCLLLLPLSDDEPGLVTFAVEECRNRGAVLLLLFLRPMAIIPMGPIPPPDLNEDSQAQAVFQRVGLEASQAGVPMRTYYEATADRSTTILEFTRTLQADVLVLGTTRRSRLWKALTGDVTQSILSHLPEHASLMIHAS
jgi:nucleotide-binding universal stress UspA family protein